LGRVKAQRPCGVGKTKSGRQETWQWGLALGSSVSPLFPFVLQELLLSNSCSAMSPASAAAPAPALVSLFDLSAAAPILQGLSLVSHAPGEDLAGAPRSSCPGIWEGLGWTHEDRHRALTTTGKTLFLLFPSLGVHADFSFCWIQFFLNSIKLWVVSSMCP
jgi:hypothetical protein